MREYPPEFWGYYANRAQGGGGLSVEDAFTEWQAEQEKEWQENQKALQEATKISSGEQEWPRMSIADDLTAQTDSLARTNEDMYAWVQREKEDRQAREAERRAEEASKKEVYEAALHSDEYTKLIKRYGADAATNIIGRRIYPEEAKAMDNFGRAVFTAVAPEVAFPYTRQGIRYGPGRRTRGGEETPK